MNKEVVSFIIAQLNQIRKGGLPILAKKLRLIAMIIFTMPMVFFVRLLRPLVIIRFGQLYTERIGHFAVNTEVYLCERDAGLHGQQILDIFYYSFPICNEQLRKMWARTLHICRFASWLDRVNRYFPGGKKHMIQFLNHDRDIYGFFAYTQPHLSFTPDEERMGFNALRQLGIPEDVNFICFYVRDPLYLDITFPGSDWSYHNYRDASVQNCIPALEELTQRGYLAIRMGAVVKEALRTTNPKIIDYSVNGRSDFLDIFLGAKCRFFISTPSGLSGIPMIFRRPIVFVDCIPLEYVPSCGLNYLFILKKLWLRKDKRFLTFREILDSGIGRFLYSEQYEKLGIEVVENTPEEIMAAALEMDERLKGTWQSTKEDEELQQHFWSFFKPNELNQVFLSRIGTEFLRQNRNLLE